MRIIFILLIFFSSFEVVAQQKKNIIKKEVLRINKRLDIEERPSLLSYFELIPYFGVISFKERIPVSAAEVSGNYLLNLDSFGQGLGVNVAYKYKKTRTEIDLFVYSSSFTGQLNNNEIQFLNSNIEGSGLISSIGFSFSPNGEEGGYFAGFKAGLFNRNLNWTNLLKSQLLIANEKKSDLGLVLDCGFKVKHFQLISKVALVKGYESILWQFGLGYNFH